MPLGGAARVEQVVDIVDRRAVRARDRAVAPARHRHDVLQGEEVVLGMRDCDAIGDVGIGCAIDMRHPEFAADDLCRIGLRLVGSGAAFGEEGFPGCERQEYGKQQNQQRPAAAFNPDHGLATPGISFVRTIAVGNAKVNSAVANAGHSPAPRAPAFLGEAIEMLQRTTLIACSAAMLASASALAMPATVSAQTVIGSGVVPSTAENSAERPVLFATAVPRDAALAVVMTGTEIPAGVDLPADTAERIAATEFTGIAGETLAIPTAAGAPPIKLFGAAGEDGEAPNWREAGGRIVQALSNEDSPIAIAGLPGAEAMAEAGLGATLGQYRFDRYKSDREELPSAPVTLVGGEASAAQALFAGRHVRLAEGVRLARDLVNEPANVLYPASFVERARAAFRGVDDVTIEVLDEEQLRARNMGTIIGVGQGSPRGSRLMLITYRGADGPPLLLAGKGITFDTGGISLKPNSGMWEMKGDMSGAAAVTGATLSLAKSDAPVHVVAAVALAENMPGANAQRPGDVVRTYSGKTIELRSTDAEGRLVLADAIEYAVAQKQPYALANIATLTGSAIRALGPEYAALFTREDADAAAAIAAGDAVAEHLWRLPLHPAYAEAMDSEIADIKNSDASPAPGASAGAHFVEFFVPEDLPWIHIDMAAVDRASSTSPLIPAGARGFGVKLLDQLARDWRPE